MPHARRPSTGHHGLYALEHVAPEVVGMYVTCATFVSLVLGAILAATGFSIVMFLRYIADEVLVVLGTSSSESALPQIMWKLENFGCPISAVGLVVPAGYSFNLDGTAIYMPMAAVFVGQVGGVHLSLSQELGLLATLLITSKGAAAVSGSGFITLAATMALFPSISVAGLALLVEVDRFMSEARAITNLVGNAVATMVVSRWEGTLDADRRSLNSWVALPIRDRRTRMGAG